MREDIAPFVIVEIRAAQPELAYWKCAAALEPALPTWVGPTWGELLSTPIDRETGTLPVLLTRDYYRQLIEEDGPSAAPITVYYFLSEHAVEILRRHGLQPILKPKCDEPDDYIPF